MKLTAKQEKFCQNILSGMSQADAYRKSYAVKTGTKASSIQDSASKLMANPLVTHRVLELRRPVIEAAQITLANHLARLQDLSEKAETLNQISASITAEVARGKASGLYIEKQEHSGHNGGPIELSRIERVIIDPKG